MSLSSMPRGGHMFFPNRVNQATLKKSAVEMYQKPTYYPLRCKLFYMFHYIQKDLVHFSNSSFVVAMRSMHDWVTNESVKSFFLCGAAKDTVRSVICLVFRAKDPNVKPCFIHLKHISLELAMSQEKLCYVILQFSERSIVPASEGEAVRSLRRNLWIISEPDMTDRFPVLSLPIVPVTFK